MHLHRRAEALGTAAWPAGDSRQHLHRRPAHWRQGKRKTLAGGALELGTRSWSEAFPCAECTCTGAAAKASAERKLSALVHTRATSQATGGTGATTPVAVRGPESDGTVRRTSLAQPVGSTQRKIARGLRCLTASPSLDPFQTSLHPSGGRGPLRVRYSWATGAPVGACGRATSCSAVRGDGSRCICLCRSAVVECAPWATIGACSAARAGCVWHRTGRPFGAAMPPSLLPGHSSYWGGASTGRAGQQGPAVPLMGGPRCHLRQWAEPCTRGGTRRHAPAAAVARFKLKRAAQGQTLMTPRPSGA